MNTSNENCAFLINSSIRYHRHWLFKILLVISLVKRLITLSSLIYILKDKDKLTVSITHTGVSYYSLLYISVT